MQSAQRNGVTLFFKEAPGSGDPVVLIHGWCCDHTYLERDLVRLKHTRRF